VASSQTQTMARTACSGKRAPACRELQKIPPPRPAS
jgi:hypothetical protein